jgi:lipid-A-disaccharide synthase
VVKELIQDELTPANLKMELNHLLLDETRRMKLKKDYSDLKALLTKGGNASENAARSITDFLKNR